jgi:hypothetical protein
VRRSGAPSGRIRARVEGREDSRRASTAAPVRLPSRPVSREACRSQPNRAVLNEGTATGASDRGRPSATRGRPMPSRIGSPCGTRRGASAPPTRRSPWTGKQSSPRTLSRHSLRTTWRSPSRSARHACFARQCERQRGSDRRAEPRPTRRQPGCVTRPRSRCGSGRQQESCCRESSESGQLVPCVSAALPEASGPRSPHIGDLILSAGTPWRAAGRVCLQPKKIVRCRCATCPCCYRPLAWTRRVWRLSEWV